MAVSSRFPSQPAARGLLRRTPQRILPVERTPRRLALVVTAVSGGPVPGGSPVPRRPPPPEDAATVAPTSVPSSAASAIDFLTLCHRLKTTKRKGWINHSIKGPESIADHMYRMALMALIAGDLPAVDRERSISSN
ncbi:HD domain containing protein [Zea mays]|uniref:HD domain containing protein n=1 Tax=Zea mays TaxID=4577 RepID=A0A1D6NHN7_MAIZE|nr:HD domain containing protein [Zea mays]